MPTLVSASRVLPRQFESRSNLVKENEHGVKRIIDGDMARRGILETH